VQVAAAGPLPGGEPVFQRRLWHTAPVQKTQSNRMRSNDPRWRPLRSFQRVDLPADADRWLLNEGSLTEQLVATSGGNFKVQRIHQGWQQPLPSEQQLLGLPPRQWALIREVALLCRDQPWVYARSVIPLATLNGPLRHLRHLQSQSLGSLIFRHASLQRSPFELARLPAGSDYIDASVRQAEPAWARRSLFSIAGKPLSVSEAFLQRFQL
jgi:chorismate--pyruvate lyase